MDDQPSGIDWTEGGVPVSRRFDDPYFSLRGGLSETRHVFLDGNDLPARFRPGFQVAELGFGTGLNLIACLLAWPGKGRFSFTSFEAFPLTPDEVMAALNAFPEAAPWATPLAQALAETPTRFALGPADVELILGDARNTLPAWQGAADAWFLDGFSPAKNPELWGQGLLSEVARHTRPGGTAATYSAAGHIRRSLAEAGFEVTRSPGFANKRHMTKARLA